jgi:hypothetical protein
MAANKRITRDIGWVKGNRPHEIRLTASLWNDDDLALELAGRADGRKQDRDVRFSIALSTTSATLIFGAIDWRPPKPHTNRLGPPHLKLRTFSGSHIHRLDDNISLPDSQFLQLPVVDELLPDPTDYDELLTRVGLEFGIVGCERIGRPEWSTLLHL